MVNRLFYCCDCQQEVLVDYIKIMSGYDLEFAGYYTRRLVRGKCPKCGTWNATELGKTNENSRQEP